MCAQLDENGSSVMVTAQRLIAVYWKVRFDAHCLIVRLIRRGLGLRQAPASAAGARAAAGSEQDLLSAVIHTRTLIRLILGLCAVPDLDHQLGQEPAPGDPPA
jgi:hypothetical protein